MFVRFLETLFYQSAESSTRRRSMLYCAHIRNHDVCRQEIAKEQAMAAVLSSQLAGVTFERDHLRELQASLQAKCTSLSDAITNTRAECERLAQQVASLEPRVECITAERDGLDSDCSCLRAELSEIHVILSQHREQAKRAQDEVCRVSQLLDMRQYG